MFGPARAGRSQSLIRHFFSMKTSVMSFIFCVVTCILEGLDEMLTVNRLGLPARLHQLNREHDGDRAPRCAGRPLE
jgi:hypothetical protein